MCTQVSVSDLSDDSVVKMFGLFSGGSDPTSGQKEADKIILHSRVDDIHANQLAMCDM